MGDGGDGSGRAWILEKLAFRISSHVKLPLSQHDRGVVALTKKFSYEDKSLPGEVSCACAETRLLGVSVAARRWLIFLHCSHVCVPFVLIGSDVFISIECKYGINCDQFHAREIVAIVARSEKQVLNIAGLRCGA